MEIRHARDADLDRVLELSNREAKWVGEKERTFFEHYLFLPDFYVTGDPVGGFVMAMGPEVDYGSKNFIWFRERYEDFLYIDRVVVDERSRKQGIASALYNHLEGPLVCEVALTNEESIIFHEKLGFREVGIFEIPPKVCRMYMLD